MIVEKGAGEIVAEILMSMQNWDGCFLLVEGDSDSRFWRAWKHDGCEIVISTGRTAALGALLALEGRDQGRVIGVVDDDQDFVLGRRLDCERIVYTHCSDLEVCQFMSGALDRVLIEYGDEVKISAFLRGGVGIRSFVLSKAAELGRVRYVHRQIESRVALKDFKVRRFVDPMLNIDWVGIEHYVVSSGIFPDVDVFREKLASVPNAELYLIAQGHDLVDMLVLALESLLGSTKAGRDRVSSLLRVGVQALELSGWKTSVDIRSRERGSNFSYLVGI